MTRVVCNEKMSYMDAACRRPNPLIAHGSLLTTQEIRVIRVPSSSICQKTRKEDFGQRDQKMQILNIHIIRQLLNNDNVIGNKRKKDLSVSRVLLKSFLRNT